MAYTCVICKKQFRDKTKWNKHRNRKFPCKYKQDKNKIEKKKYKSCIFCNKKIKGTYEEHFQRGCEECLVNNIKFSFKSKNFAKKLFKNYGRDAVDLYILTRKDNNNKNKFYFMKNLYVLKDKVNNLSDYHFSYYIAIKDVNKFIDKINEKELQLNKEIEIELDKLKSILGEIINEINGIEIDFNKPIIKNISEFKCPKCKNCFFGNTYKLFDHLKSFHGEIFEEYEDEYDESDDEDENIKSKLLELISSGCNECNLCGKKFSTRGNMDRHKIKCKKKLNLSENMDYLIEKNNKLEDEMKSIKRLLQSEKKKNNIINNTTNIMQNNIQININDFGKEDISHISMEFVKGLISKMNSYSIVKYIEKVHFSNPMNMNILIPNSKDKFILLKNGDTWTMNDKNLVLNGIIVKNFDRINDAYEKMSSSLPSFVKKMYNDYADTFEIKNEPNERFLVKQKTEAMIMNKQKEVISGGIEDITDNHSYLL